MSGLANCNSLYQEFCLCCFAFSKFSRCGAEPSVTCFVSRLIVDSDSLTITDVTENDAGVYTCIMNTTLDHDSASAELTVVGKFSFAEAPFHWLIKQTHKLLKVAQEMWIRPVTYKTDCFSALQG